MLQRIARSENHVGLFIGWASCAQLLQGDVYYNPLSWRFLLMVCIEPCCWAQNGHHGLAPHWRLRLDALYGNDSDPAHGRLVDNRCSVPVPLNCTQP